MEKFTEIINFLFNKNNYTTVLIFVCVIFLVFWGSWKYTIPEYQKWREEAADIVEKKAQYEILLQKKEQRIAEEKSNIMKYEKVPVKIFHSETEGLPVESASIGFVSNILKMLETTHNSVMDISYKIDALNESEKNSVPSNVSVVQLVMTIDGTYTSFMDFITTLYNYNYLATIKSIRAIPLKENKNILEINVVIWLYVSK